jgi:ribose-phosphate pyrophosphokinase
MKYIILDSRINLTSKNEKVIQYKTTNFPAGEVFIKIETPLSNEDVVTIIANPRSSNDVMILLMANDAIRRMGVSRVSLFMPYVPYGRQDRVVRSGESFSMDVFARLINSCNFYKVVIADPHSDVTTNLLNNVKHVNLSLFYMNSADRLRNEFGVSGIIAPDAGATARADYASKVMHIPLVAHGQKKRHDDGSITITLSKSNIPKSVVIVDDICDGGKTFIELAKVLRQDYGVECVTLVVTHGIFSKGTSVILDEIDCIITYNDFTITGDITDHVWAKENFKYNIEN